MEKRGSGRERKLQQERERERDTKEGKYIDRKRKEERKELGIQTENKILY